MPAPSRQTDRPTLNRARFAVFREGFGIRSLLGRHNDETRRADAVGCLQLRAPFEAKTSEKYPSPLGLGVKGSPPEQRSPATAFGNRGNHERGSAWEFLMGAGSKRAACFPRIELFHEAVAI